MVTALLPQCVLAGSLLGVLTLGAFLEGSRRLLRFLGLAALVAAACLVPWARAEWGIFAWDGAARLWSELFFIGAIPLMLLMSGEDETGVALTLASVLGMSVIAAARNLLGLFIGLELMSLPAYLLVYTLRRGTRTLEASLKYFFAGGVAGALFLLGLALAYAASGTFDFALLTGATAGVAVVLMGAAALFKIGVFPLHFWLPDVYEAAAPELVGFLSTAMKAAGFLLLIRILALVPAGWTLPIALPVLAVCTMTIGNFLAWRQESLQRLLAYSSVAHAGYILLGVAAWNFLGYAPAGGAAVYFYLASYLAMNAGAFAAVKLSGAVTVSDLRGLSKRGPGTAAFLALMVISLAGVPPTAGFLAKLFVFWDAVRAGLYWPVALAVVNSLVGMAYYFRLVRVLYFEEPQPGAAAPASNVAGSVVLWACAIPTVLMGIAPWAVDLFARMLPR